MMLRGASWLSPGGLPSLGDRVGVDAVLVLLELCAGRAGAAAVNPAAPPEPSRHRSQPDAPGASSELQHPASHRSFPGNICQIQVLAGRGGDGFPDVWRCVPSPGAAGASCHPKAKEAPSSAPPEPHQSGLPPPSLTQHLQPPGHSRQPLLILKAASSGLNFLYFTRKPDSSCSDAVSFPRLHGWGVECSIPVFPFQVTPKTLRVAPAVAAGRRQRATAARR
ncbi:uncharacterized protein LOC107213965 isoform X2 [Parus major]|uniref:uncharacterized protein LOC107213965 isoform X2 n=1 Tax=Parus major TaxID=9157 RepID=UPI0007710548|nr:uncharacterized protein LOC107213965 isoform X2 [Parus major]